MIKRQSPPLEYILTQVENPGRYAGSELNICDRKPEDADLDICLIYPDSYEIGMPFLGFQILYHIINRDPSFLAERCYAPWQDMENLLKEHGMPLFSLENKRPLADFDILGFTLPYELDYTNILKILALGGIPLLSGERKEDMPLVIAGGACSYNPEPLRDFIDLFVIGDGEEILPVILREIRDMKADGIEKKQLLNSLNRPADGIYIPAVYDRRTDPPVKAQKVPVLLPEYYPEKPLVPLIDITHDRWAQEIQRGCTEGCRFCQAGMLYRPVRERKPSDLLRQTENTLRATGYEEMSLLSLSTSDYSALDSYLEAVKPIVDSERVSISFPSLRLDNMSDRILEMASSKRKSGFTFAPEAGSQRLRNAINKNISDEDLYSTVDLALKKGWRTLKFYYMVGLPTETDEDLLALVDQIHRISDLTGKYGKINVNVTLSSFIPKPFTPFQWSQQDSPEEMQRKIDLIKHSVRRRNVNIKSRDPHYSLIEGILARGGAECGPLLLNAWSSGAGFDAWKDKFNINIWRKALNDAGIDAVEQISEKSKENGLPWDFIDSGIETSYLLAEYDRALRGITTRDCRDGCTACGVCDFRTLKMDIASQKIETVVAADERKAGGKIRTEGEKQTWRVVFSKTGDMRYSGHHDLFRILQRAANILELPLAYSSGFNKRPKIAMGYPVPMGYTALHEYLDMTFTEDPGDFMAALNSVLPAGLRIRAAELLEKGAASIMASTRKLRYSAEFFGEQDAKMIAETLEELNSRENLVITRRHPAKEDRQLDIRPFVETSAFRPPMGLELHLNVLDGRTVRLPEFLSLVFSGTDIPPFLGTRDAVLI